MGKLKPVACGVTAVPVRVLSCILPAQRSHRIALERVNMTENMRAIKPKKPENDTPTIIDSTTNPDEQKHKKMERMADHAAHKANKTQQQNDEENNQFSNIGPH
jgi:hypothetical protein